LPLLPEQPIGKARNVRHVDATAAAPAALLHRLERHWNKRADRRKNDRGIEWLRRHLVRAAGPDRTERLCKCLRRIIAAAGEGVDAPALPGRDLGQNVRGGATAAEAERVRPRPLAARPPPRARHAVAAPTDQAGA